MCVSVTLLSLSACEDELVQKRHPTIGGKTIGDDDDRPGGFQQNNGETYPYPKVIFKELIPPYDLFASKKTLAWRIEWPWYDSDYDFNLIPGVLSVKTGELNSFSYLNNAEPQKTFDATLSLYYGNKVEGVISMWYELDYTFDTPGDDAIEDVQFAPGTISAKIAQHWAEERPTQFEHHFPAGPTVDQLNYGEGDFIHFRIPDRNLYGGIRIVSMMPRIIEVYLAVDNL